jgi:hypothetical protein
MKGDPETPRLTAPDWAIDRGVVRQGAALSTKPKTPKGPNMMPSIPLIGRKVRAIEI